MTKRKPSSSASSPKQTGMGVIKDKYLVLAAVGTLAVLQLTSLVGQVSLKRDESSRNERELASRRLSTDLGNGRCAWTKAMTYSRWEPIPRPTTLFAGYPGSGKRLAWMMIEALTGYVAGDDWDLSQHGLHVISLKTGYPHKEGKWGWGDYMDQVILEVRNPRWAIPSYHTMRTELDWSETWGESFFRIPWVYTKRPPNQEWEAWRDANFDEEVVSYGRYIDFWMSGGAMPQDDGSTVQDLHCGVSDSVGWMDMPDCKPKAVVMFENLFDNTTAHNNMTLGAYEMHKIAEVIDDSPDSTVIANDTWYCIYNETYGQHRFNRHRDANPRFPDSVPRDTYNFTIPQLQAMLDEVTRLYNKYSNPPWDTDPLAQDLASYMQQYMGELDEELKIYMPNPPCDLCPSGFSAFMDDGTIGTAVQLYLTDRASAIEQYGDINCWHTYPVTSMNSLFTGAAFNEDISCWDTSSVGDMTQMFRGSTFNRDISSWDTSSVGITRSMFLRSSFNQDVSQWDVTSLQDMRTMFYRNPGFNQDLCAWGNKLTISDPTMMSSAFTGTACPVDYPIDLSREPAGPFCVECA
mmetsp:Transcript_27549/g.56435  ORF Transcript_27549/g.56435 Transcript_27549/m.56435 type:complete len:576 (-) Transcript_27549:152-1879(-)